jgi:hypothetical protein
MLECTPSEVWLKSPSPVKLSPSQCFKGVLERDSVFNVPVHTCCAHIPMPLFNHLELIPNDKKTVWRSALDANLSVQMYGIDFSSYGATTTIIEVSEKLVETLPLHKRSDAIRQMYDLVVGLAKTACVPSGTSDSDVTTFPEAAYTLRNGGKIYKGDSLQINLPYSFDIHYYDLAYAQQIGFELLLVNGPSSSANSMLIFGARIDRLKKPRTILSLYIEDICSTLSAPSLLEAFKEKMRETLTYHWANTSWYHLRCTFSPQTSAMALLLKSEGFLGTVIPSAIGGHRLMFKMERPKLLKYLAPDFQSIL